MVAPVLLAVDVDRDVLNSVESQLVKRYGADYAVEALSAPERALGRLEELARSGEEVALVLAGQSLGDGGGGKILERARQLHPHAKRALVVPGGAWADAPSAEAILDAMSLGL